MTYNIWIAIEEHDDETDTHQDVDEPVGIGPFDTLADVALVRDHLAQMAETFYLLIRRSGDGGDA